MIIHGLSTEKTSKIIPALLSYFEVCVEIPDGNLTCTYLLLLNNSEAVKNLHYCQNNTFFLQ